MACDRCNSIRQTDSGTDRWMDRWTDKQTNGWTDGQKKGHVEVGAPPQNAPYLMF